MKANEYKRILSVCVLLAALIMTACGYHAPEGYTKEHHTLAEIEEYAKALDPQATVSDEYQDLSEDNREFRIWPAVIDEISCNVASASANVYNDGVAGGEFSRTYYLIDTDYDYYRIEKTLGDHPELGEIKEDNAFNRFQVNDVISSEVTADSLNTQQLESLWDSYCKMNDALSAYPLHKSYWLEIIVAGKKYYFTGTAQEDFEDVRGRMKEDGVLE